MKTTSWFRSAVRLAATTVGVSAGLYGMYAAMTWFRYGRVAEADEHSRDELLDRFMPVYEIAERHHVRVLAPADVTLEAAMTTDLQASPIVRAIFKARELVLGAKADAASRPEGLLAQVRSLGWRVLAETPGRELWSAPSPSPGGPTSCSEDWTRVATTDATARARFRLYWVRFSAGIVLIRCLMLPDLKATAERRHRLASGRRLA